MAPTIVSELHIYEYDDDTSKLLARETGMSRLWQKLVNSRSDDTPRAYLLQARIGSWARLYLPAAGTEDNFHLRNYLAHPEKLSGRKYSQNVMRLHVAKLSNHIFIIDKLFWKSKVVVVAWSGLIQTRAKSRYGRQYSLTSDLIRAIHLPNSLWLFSVLRSLHPSQYTMIEETGSSLLGRIKWDSITYRVCH